MTTGRTSWPGYRVYYFDRERTDALLLDGVRPALAPAGDRWFFVRHWHRGPHLKICLLLDDDEARQVTEPIRRGVADYLESRPSRARLDGPTVLAAHRVLAETEHIDEPLTPLATDNTVVAAAYDRRLEILGGAEAADLFEDFYRATNQPVFTALRAFADGADAWATGMKMMWAVAATSGMPLRRAFLSFRSHAEGFIMGSPHPAETRRFLENSQRPRAEPLADALRGLLADMDAGRPPSLIADVLTALSELRGRIANAVTDGHVSLPAEGPSKQREWDHRMLRDSPFHEALQRRPDYHLLIAGDRSFQTYRIQLNLLYLHLSRLGLSGLDRMVLAYLAAGAVEDVLGVSALDLVSGSNS
jgi:hypothetical protein